MYVNRAIRKYGNFYKIWLPYFEDEAIEKAFGHTEWYTFQISTGKYFKYFINFIRDGIHDMSIHEISLPLKLTERQSLFLYISQTTHIIN